MPILWLLQAIAAPLDPATPALDPRWHALGCPVTSGSDVVVCAQHRDRYRLPRTLESTAPCGIFAGQRRCGKAETRRYGYGGGRDPITVLTRLATTLADPDAELGAPAPVPAP